jgi:hypothetical protein
MIKNLIKDSTIKSRPINSQKIKNLIHLNDLKKLKKYSLSINSNNNDYFSIQKKLIFKKLANKYFRGPDYYYKKVISDIIDNEPSHLVASFKEYLIMGDFSEFLQGYFNLKEIIKFLPLIFEYYHCSTVIFPNYVNLEEKKYIYKNIQKKQKIINIQQEQEEIDEKIKKKKLEKEKRKKNDIINYESDSTSKSDIITTHALNSILNQTNTSNNRNLFGINTNNNTREEIVEFIEKLKNEEKKINLKNQNQKNRNRHMIAIHKGNNAKKYNNKSNNTNTCNTLSTKNNTKAKEKSNIDGKSFSDKNIKNNYNLSSINLNYSKNINKLFILKLGQIKKKNEVKTPRNILLEISSLNTSKKIKKINFFSNKFKFLTEFNNKSQAKVEKKVNEKEKEKETLQIQNYTFKHLKRIKSLYGMNQINSRNRKVFCDSSIFSKDTNNSNKNISKNGKANFKICSTLNDIYKNDNKLLSIDIDKKQKKIIPKKNNCVKDSNIVNVIYSKRLPVNYSSKNCINDSKHLIKKKIRNIINIPIEKRTNSNKKQKSKNENIIFSPNTSKMINPFEIKISPPISHRNENKKILKYSLLSPNNINSKFSTSKIIHKKILNQNIQLNSKKIQFKKDIKKIHFKKDIKKIIKENKSNKIIKRKNIIEGKQLYIDNDYLTINIDKNHKHSPSPVDMKKSIEKRNNNSIKSRHLRTKTLYNKLPEFFNKYKK